MQTQFGDWSIALGIDWIMPSNAREIRAEKKRRPKDHYVLSSVAGQHWLGFHAPVTGKAYAGALLVAMVKPNAVVFFPIDAENAWVCAISDGMPVSAYDRVMPLTDARNTAIEWASLFPKADMVGDINGAQASLADVFAVLDEGLQAKAIQKKQISVALLNKNGVSIGRIVIVAVACAVVLAALFGAKTYTDYKRKAAESQMSMEEAARQAMSSAMDKAKFEAERKAKQEAFDSQVAAARKELEGRPSVASFWAAFSTVRQSLPLSLHGYKPQAIDCTVQQCRVSWQGFGRFTSAAEKLLLPNVDQSLTNDLNASSSFPLAVAVDGLPSSQAKSPDELKFLLQSFFAVHSKGFQTEPMQPVTVTPPGGLNVPPQTLGQLGKWRLQMQGSSAIVDGKTVLALMARWPVRVTSIKYQPAAGLVDLEGEFIFLSEKKG